METPDEFDDYAASVASRRLTRGEQTAEQHQAEAIEVLRDILDDPHTKSADRLRAATDLAKLTAGTGVIGPRSILSYSDEELLEFVAQARAERSGEASNMSAGKGPVEVPREAQVPVPLAPPQPQPADFPFENDDAAAKLAALFAEDYDRAHDYSDLM